MRFFYAGFLNLFNHANFGYPDPFADDSPDQFGAIGSTLNLGREIQLSGENHF